VNMSFAILFGNAEKQARFSSSVQTKIRYT